MWLPFLLRFVTEKSYSKKPNVVCDTTTVRETCGSQRQAINYRLVSWCNAYDKSKHRTCCMPLGSRCSVPSLTTSESYVRIARFPGLRKVRAQRHFRLETRDSIINVNIRKMKHASSLQNSCETPRCPFTCAKNDPTRKPSSLSPKTWVRF